MATFTVTTDTDVVDANDGVTSLREAIALARAADGADVIKFSGLIKTVELTGGALTIEGGEELTIDGDRNDDGIGDVTIDAKTLSHHLTVEAGARVTVDGVAFVNGRGVGADGAAGTNGAAGDLFTLNGGAGAAGQDGGSAAGAILNRGDLTLKHVVITDSSATGGDAGAGGRGGSGQTAIGSTFGQTGGSGGKGADGGDGGSAAGGVLNDRGASLRLVDVSFDNVSAAGGSGARGGDGGAGASGSSPSGTPFASPGGNGGNGGDAGSAGQAGHTGGALVNLGTLLGTALVGESSATGAAAVTTGATGGARGAGASGSNGGATGQPGLAGRSTGPGAAGETSDTLADDGSSSATITDGGSLIYLNATSLSHVEGDSGSTTYTFHIDRTGFLGEDSVSWTVALLGTTTAADFVGGLPSGTVTFAANQRSAAVTFQVRGDTTVETDEFFNIVLSNPQSGTLGTSTVQGAILTDDTLATVYSNASQSVEIEQIFTLQELAVATRLIGAGQAIEIDAAGPLALGALTVGASGVTFEAGAGVTGALTLGEGVASLTLAGASGLSATGNGLANTITGNAGANTLNGGVGADTMSGGAGNDTYIIDNTSDRVVEAANGGTDSVRSSVNFTLSANVENLTLTGGTAFSATGNTLNNRLEGTNNANELVGLGGSDTMVGFGGDDVYYVDSSGDVVIEAANGGIDRVKASVSHALAANVENLQLTGSAISGIGNTLANAITGTAGNNIIDGGLGNDTLTGGAGNDRFTFSTALGANNVDAITDFEAAGAVDSIRLSNAIFTSLPTGALAANAFVIGTQAQDGLDRIIYNSNTGALLFDRDGTGTQFSAVQFAKLETGLAMSAADFTVI